MMVIGAFGPTLAAILLSYRKYGLESVKILLNRELEFRFDRKWYLPILILNSVTIIIGFAGAIIISGESASLFDFSLIGTEIITWIIMLALLLPGDPINEEFG
ncbi:MAG: hypothetical protein HeimC3_08970 [Candidatus Heimdallarchaeota archaeon LC_3]|nr:MAG: hypothetical protein HeimC3_08970 [Candidatus Heimdallarchaeota archaeon LC_3]